jgi:undecaprenyl-diphosphatase
VNDLLQIVLLGVIEGVTEFLPISSTGHLLIAEQLGLGARSELFNIVIQAGAILAITILYWGRIVELVTRMRAPEQRAYSLKLLLAFGITSVLGLVVKKLGFELPDQIAPVAWALIIGGFLMLGAEWLVARKVAHKEVTWLSATVVGVAQVLAGVFPGASRSATTIFGAMLSGTSDREAATEFSFLVGIPTMYAASAYAILKQAKAGGLHEDMGAVAIGFVVSAITAFGVVRWLLRYVRTHSFAAFAVYRIALGAVLLWFFSGTARS